MCGVWSIVVIVVVNIVVVYCGYSCVMPVMFVCVLYF